MAQAVLSIDFDAISMWVTFEGAAGLIGALTYDLGTPGSTATSKLYATVTSKGFDAAGNAVNVTRTVYATKVMRGAWTAGGAHLANNETVVGSDLKVRFAISRPVYQKCGNNGAGSSGVNPVAVIAAGVATGSGYSSTANAALSCTNSSTRAYPKVVGQWDLCGGVAPADRVTGDWNLAFHARHKFGVACVLMTAADRSASPAQSTFVTAQTTVTRPRTALVTNVFKSSAFNAAGFAQGDLIDCRAQAYPKIGDSGSVLDTDSFTTTATECQGRNKLTFLLDRTGAAVRYGCVNVSTGNNATGVVSNTLATAQAAKYQHIGKAIEAGANVIYLDAGTHPAVGTAPSARVANTTNAVVQPAPGESAATVTVQIATAVRTYKCARIQYKNLTITKVDASSYLDGEDASNFLRFSNCKFSAGGVATTAAALGYRSHCTYFEDCYGDLGRALWYLGAYSSSRTNYQLDGCILDDTSANADYKGSCLHRVAGCVFAGKSFFLDRTPGANNPTMDNFIWSGVMFTKMNYTSAVFNLFTVNQVLNGGVFENIAIEDIVTGGGAPTIQIAADSSFVEVDNLMLLNVTVCGDRGNYAYKERGDTDYPRTDWTVRRLASWHCNVKDDTYAFANTSITHVGAVATLTQAGHGYHAGSTVRVAAVSPSEYNGDFVISNVTTDTFDYTMGGTPATNATVVGTCGPHANRFNPEIRYGVDWQDCRYEDSDSAAFEPEYAGINCSYARGTIAYVMDASATGYGGLGGGDYTPAVGSALLAQSDTSEPYIPTDLFGRAYANAIGAVQPRPAILTMTAHTNPLPLYTMLQTAKSSLVDIGWIGNSESLKDGAGFDHAVQDYFYRQAALGLYGTGVHSLLEGEGSAGAGVGYGDSNTEGNAQVATINNGTNFSTYFAGRLTAPAAQRAALDESGFATSAAPRHPLYVNTGSASGVTGITIGNAAFDLTLGLTFTLWHVLFASAGGSFNPVVRRDESPFTTIKDFGSISTNGTDGAISKVQWAAGADGTRSGWTKIALRTHTSAGTPNIASPFFGTYSRIHRTAATKGVAVTMVYADGGESAYDMYNWVLNTPQSTYDHLFDAMTEPQGATKGSHRCIMCLDEGTNQAVETNIHANAPDAVTAYSTANFVFYFTEIVRLVTAAWVASGRSSSNLAWRVSVSHPNTNETTEARLVAYRAAMPAAFAAYPQVTILDRSAILSQSQLTGRGYYLQSDTIHLGRGGYLDEEDAAWRDLEAWSPPRTTGLRGRARRTTLRGRR